MTKQRIGVHLGTSGGCWTAVARAVEAGANTFQIFSSSPRTWKFSPVKPDEAEKMHALRLEHDVSPLVIHASYLINLCSQTETVRENGVRAFRGEVERALAWGAEYLVLHPGSWKGLTRRQGLRFAELGIEQALDGVPWPGKNFQVLIENTAGAEFSLGGSIEQVAEMVEAVKRCVPVGVCLDTCHLHVKGYDIVSAEGWQDTAQLIEQTVGFDAVKVWHCNDAKAACGSRLDRHQHIGEGTIGPTAFQRLLNDSRFAHAAFIAETPVDEPGDYARNVAALRALAAR